MNASAIVHLELHTGDLPAARALYAAACGWHPPRGDDAAYQPLDLGGGLTGGIVAARGGSSLWLPYVRVECVDAAATRATEAGAEILLGPQDGPTGRRAVVSTQPGAQIAFWQPAPGTTSPRPPS
jgi:predicted enzyme related to lactoylglutathione lyase